MPCEEVNLPELTLNTSSLGALGRTYEEKILAQYHATDTLVNQIYTPPAGFRTAIRTVNVCNSDTSDHKWSLYIDKGGTTYDITSVVIKNADVLAEETALVPDTPYYLEVGDNVAFQANFASQLTITLFGTEISL